MNATGQRWINELANFNFSIHYKPGEQNVVADALSRFPIEKEYCRDQYSKTCSSVEVKSIFDGAINQQHDNETWIAVVNVTSNSFDDIQTEILYGEGNNKCSISKDDIAKAQEEENWIKTVKDTIRNKNSLDKETISSNSFQLKGLMREFKHLLVGTDNILYRKIKGKEDKQVVLPSRLKPLVYKELHVNMGHLGYERNLELIRERFYWPQMNDEVKHFVGKICKCVKDKRPVRLPQAPQKSITSSAPMELVGLDFLHLDTCVGGFQYLLVITDHFTRYTQVYPTRNKEAKTAADKLFNDYILRFGMPGKIIHDQGREFENKLFHQLSRSCNIKRHHTIPSPVQWASGADEPINHLNAENFRKY